MYIMGECIYELSTFGHTFYSLIYNSAYQRNELRDRCVWCVVQDVTGKIVCPTWTSWRRPWLCGEHRCCPDWRQLPAARLRRSRQPRTAYWRPTRSPYTRCTVVYCVFSRPSLGWTRPRWQPLPLWSGRPRWLSSRRRRPLPVNRRRRPPTARRRRPQTPRLDLPVKQNRLVEAAASYRAACSTVDIAIGHTCRRRH